MSFLKKLAGETAIYGISSILGRVLNFIILAPYLTRVFDTDQYGIHSILYAFAAFMMVFYTYRMETTFFRFASREGQAEKTYSNACLLLIGITAVMSLILYALHSSLTDLFTGTDQSQYLIYFIAILALDTLMAIPFARLRLEHRSLRFAALKLLNVIINVLAIIFFLEYLPTQFAESDSSLGWYDPSRQLDYVFIANLIASALIFAFFIPSYFKLQWSIDRVLMKKMIRYAGPLVIVGLAGIVNLLSDKFFLKSLLPGSNEEVLSQIGIYGANIKLAIFMTLFTQAFNYAAEPFFFNQSSSKKAPDMYARVALAFTIVGTFVFLAVTTYIDQIQFIIGADYRSGIQVVPILLLAYFLLGLYYNFSIWFKLTDKTIYGAWIAIGGALITVLLNILLIPKMGYMGSAWAALACYAFMAACSYAIGKKHYPVPYPIFRMGFYTLIALLIYAGGIYWTQIFPAAASWKVPALSMVLCLLGLWIWNREKFYLFKLDQ